ncbi:unnamed protein product [Lepeophtheirus salmonis]|uniref:(salmon louse) hypothetical protein n=1 Tax=Lepeophtheirus salmonis TaxID=72036 RepID=A0A7R8CGD3_LEPSM|nr:unnamed protein product [Lepeophtheirus salmonis]CAF2815289.1 unnamed protein product [Lepeophtheirus salmonis]
MNLQGDQVRNKVIDEVTKSKYYCIIFDSTPDISNISQTSQVLRFVKITDNEVKVKEPFLCFIEMKGKNVEQITSMILKQLKMDDFNIQDCHGQAFDNAAVMVAHQSCVQIHIREVTPNIVFVPCNNHCLSLAAVHEALGVANSVTFFGTLDRLFQFLSASTHPWYILIEITGETIKRACETRWSSRSYGVKVIHIKFTDTSLRLNV